MNHTIQANLDSARTLLRAGNRAEAKNLYQSVLSQDENNPEALHFLGVLHYQENDLYKGVELISAAINEKPDYEDAYINLGNILLGLREINEAYACYKKAYELAPNRYETLTNYGILLRYVGELEQSEKLLQQAVNQQSSVPAGFYNLANTQLTHGRFDAAITNFQRCIALDENFKPSYSGFTRACYCAGRSAEAVEIYEKLLLANPNDATLLHMRAAVSGENIPTRATSDYVRDLFDKHANSFEQNLRDLGYQSPQLMASRLQVLLPPDASLDILDACCGTGFCAPHLKPYANRLVGFDLSSVMLDRAREKYLYDELICQDLIVFMLDKSTTYDLIVSMDALIYFGELDEVIQLLGNALKPGGSLIFSLEQPTDDTPDTNSYALAPHGRYVHAHDYVATLMHRHKLQIRELSESIIRQEMGKDVSGWMCVGQKTST